MNIRQIAVLGAGTMGHGIAHAAIAAGYETHLFDVSFPTRRSSELAIEGIVRKGVEIGKVSSGDADAMLRRLSATGDLAQALGGADLVIEAAPERIDLKLQLFAEIQRLAQPGAMVGSNTSALSITEMAATLSNPSRVAGMHFFNPVHKMKLVEIVQALESAPATLEAIAGVAARMGRKRCWSGDRRGSSRPAGMPGWGTRRFTCRWGGGAPAAASTKRWSLASTTPRDR